MDPVVRLCYIVCLVYKRGNYKFKHYLDTLSEVKGDARDKNKYKKYKHRMRFLVVTYNDDVIFELTATGDLIARK